MYNLVIVGCLIVIFCIWYYTNSKVPSHFPPGPPRYPLIGSLPFMMRRGRNATQKSLMLGILHNVSKYGNIVGFYLGSKPFVVIADYDMMKELLKHESLSGRPKTVPISEFRPGHGTEAVDNLGRNLGVLLSQGSHWREHRRFLLRNLRDFGFGKNEMEDAILDEIEKLSSELQKKITF